jgi:SSS family solute:Na+ symporter
MNESISTDPITWVYVAVYIVLMLAAGTIASRLSRNASDFLIGGRSFGWLLQGIGLSALIIAGTTVSVAPALGYSIGLLGHWWTTGWILAVLFGAYVVAPIFRRSGAYTFPEWIGARYGSRARTVAALAYGMALIFSPLANILGGGLVLSTFTGWEPVVTISAMGLLTAAYLCMGGLQAAIITNVAQWLIAIVMVLFLPIFLVTKYGGFETLATLPAEYFTVTWNDQFPLFSPGVKSVFGMFWLMGCIYFGGSTWNRAASCRTTVDARKAWIFAAVVSLPMAFILPLSGMYLKASGVELANPSGAFGYLIGQMPSALGSLFIVGVIAATMSTAELGIVAGSTILLRDVYQRVFRPEADLKQLLWPARVFTMAYALVGGVIGSNLFYIWNPKLAALYGLALFAGFAAAGLPPLFGSILWKRSSREGAYLGMLAGTAATFLVVIFPLTQWHAMYVGFAVSLIVFVTVSIAVSLLKRETNALCAETQITK